MACAAIMGQKAPNAKRCIKNRPRLLQRYLVQNSQTIPLATAGSHPQATRVRPGTGHVPSWHERGALRHHRKLIRPAREHAQTGRYPPRAIAWDRPHHREDANSAHAHTHTKSPRQRDDNAQSAYAHWHELRRDGATRAPPRESCQNGS